MRLRNGFPLCAEEVAALLSLSRCLHRGNASQIAAFSLSSRARAESWTRARLVHQTSTATNIVLVARADQVNVRREKNLAVYEVPCNF